MFLVLLSTVGNRASFILTLNVCYLSESLKVKITSHLLMTALYCLFCATVIKLHHILILSHRITGGKLAAAAVNTPIFNGDTNAPKSLVVLLNNKYIICLCRRLVWCSGSLVYNWTDTAGPCHTCRVSICLLPLWITQSLGSNSCRFFNTSCRYV